MTDFILALALICPAANEVAVQEVLLTKPISFKDCEAKVDELRPKYNKEKGDCELDLICVRVRWKGEPD